MGDLLSCSTLVGVRVTRHLIWIKTEHLSPESRSVVVVTVSVTLHLSFGAARGTAFWLISKAFGLVEFLVPSAEGEGSPTIGTFDRFVRKTHWMTSSFKTVG